MGCPVLLFAQKKEENYSVSIINFKRESWESWGIFITPKMKTHLSKRLRTPKPIPRRSRKRPTQGLWMNTMRPPYQNPAWGHFEPNLGYRLTFSTSRVTIQRSRFLCHSACLTVDSYAAQPQVTLRISRSSGHKSPIRGYSPQVAG